MSIQAANGANLLINRATIWFDRFDANGNLTGLRFLGESDKFEITPNVTTKEYFTQTKAANNKIANVPINQKHTLAISLKEFTPKNVALAMLGDDIAITQTMTTVTAEVIAGGAGQAIPTKGQSYLTALKKISAVTLTAFASDGTTTTALVLGTDYQIEDANVGLITLLSTASAPVGGTVKAAYTAAATTTTKVTAGTSIKILGKFYVIGDPTNGPKMNVSVWKAQVEPSGALAFLGDDFASMSLSAEILDDSANHPTAPLYEVHYPS